MERQGSLVSNVCEAVIASSPDSSAGPRHKHHQEHMDAPDSWQPKQTTGRMGHQGKGECGHTLATRAVPL